MHAYFFTKYVAQSKCSLLLKSIKYRVVNQKQIVVAKPVFAKYRIYADVN